VVSEHRHGNPDNAHHAGRSLTLRHADCPCLCRRSGLLFPSQNGSIQEQPDVFSQVYAPYCLAADFSVRLQGEILMQWFKGWSELVAAMFGTGRVQTDDEREPLTRNGRGEAGGGQPVAAPSSTEAAETRTAGSGWESYNIAMADEVSVLRHAYFKWVDERYPDGQHLRHYFEALHEVRG
jgi:hypothetical protein